MRSFQGREKTLSKFVHTRTFFLLASPPSLRFQWALKRSPQFLAECRDTWKRLTRLVFSSLLFSTSDSPREQRERANSHANWRELARIFTRYGLKFLFKRATIKRCPLVSPKYASSWNYSFYWFDLHLIRTWILLLVLFASFTVSFVCNLYHEIHKSHTRYNKTTYKYNLTQYN